MLLLQIFMKHIDILMKSIKLKISNKNLKESIIKIMKLMVPFTPHIAYECLSNLNVKYK